MGERGGCKFIALCIILIESLSFLLAFHCLCCSTSISLWLLHMPTNKFINFLIGDEVLLLLLCCPWADRSDRFQYGQQVNAVVAALFPLLLFLPHSLNICEARALFYAWAPWDGWTHALHQFGTWFLWPFQSTPSSKAHRHRSFGDFLICT